MAQSKSLGWVVIVGVLGIAAWLGLREGSRRSAPPATIMREATVAAESAAPPAPTPATYVVRLGDGWATIAAKSGVTMGALLAENGATTETVIHPGNVVRLPAGAVAPVVHATITVPTYAPTPTAIPVSAPRVVAADSQGGFISYEGNGGGPTLCADGSSSHSSGRGTCSHHGGTGGGGYHSSHSHHKRR